MTHTPPPPNFPPQPPAPAPKKNRTNAIIIGSAAALIAAIIGTGIVVANSRDDDSDTPFVAQTTSSPAPTVNPQEQYLETAHGIPFNGTPSDTELLLYPEMWCNELDAGHSVEWMFDMTQGGGLYPIGEKWGTKKEDANELLVAGVKAYCPENLPAAQDELRASGEY